MKKLILTALLVMGLAATPALAKDGRGVKIGVLSCDVAAGVGVIIASSRAVDCTFERSVGGRNERYKGTIDRVGLDIGITGKAVMAWVVFAPGKMKRGALAGSYAGISAEASVAVGVGANALIGGSNKSIALQPLSLQAQTGVNVAAGIAALRLKYVK